MTKTTIIDHEIYINTIIKLLKNKHFKKTYTGGGKYPHPDAISKDGKIALECGTLSTKDKIDVLLNIYEEVWFAPYPEFENGLPFFSIFKIMAQEKKDKINYRTLLRKKQLEEQRVAAILTEIEQTIPLLFENIHNKLYEEKAKLEKTTRELRDKLYNIYYDITDQTFRNENTKK